MAKILFVMTGADGWTLADGTTHRTGFWAEEAVVPFEAFGFDGEPGWFRLSVGSVSEGAIGEELARLRGALERLDVEPRARTLAVVGLPPAP